MRRAAILLATAALVAGCGGDDDGDESGSATEPAAPPTRQPTTQEPERNAPAPDRATLEACLDDANLNLTPGDEPAENPKGEKRSRKPLTDYASAYLGYVQWPSKRIADVYLTKHADEADALEKEAQGFVAAFGLDPSKYVRRANTVVLTFDDPPPTAGEAKAVEDCAAG
jgi:hypothetical protein